MSNRQELLALRQKLIVGEPPYTKDTHGSLKRENGGFAGLDERKVMGDYSPDAIAIRGLMEACLLLVDHLLERVKA